MENKRNIKFFINLLWGGTLFVLPFFVLAYSDSTTHPALTQEIIKFYNSDSPEKQLSNADAEIIIQGSIDEDAETRWLYHFYDPVYDRGLVLEDDAFPKDPNLALVASGARSEWASSKTWGTDSSLQSGFFDSLTAGIITEYFSGEKDYSWERAIYEYTWGDKTRGLSALGHVLHLIEDASVPDHTRNDPHPPVLDLGSPYEGWTAQFTRQNINLSPITERPVILSDLGDYFNSLAKYSNNNFFSKDTIFEKNYNSPKTIIWNKEKLGDGLIYNFGYSVSGIRLVLDRGANWVISDKSKYIINDPDDKILTDYWTRLSKQSVLHGAGVIKLFFAEVEKERNTRELYNKNRSWLGKTYDATSNTVSRWWDKTTDTVSDTYNSLSASISNTWNYWSWSYSAPEESNLAGSIFGLNTETADKAQPPTTSPMPAPIVVSPPPPAPPSSITYSTEINPGTNFLPKVAGTSIAVNPPPSNTSYNVPMAGGGGAPPASAEASAGRPTPTNADSSGQSPPPAPPPAESSEPEPPPAPEPPPPEPEEPPQDTEAPDITFNIIECANSLSQGNCVLTSPELTLAWSSDAGDLDHFTLNCETTSNPCPNFLSGQTTATGTRYTAPYMPGIYIFSLTATDETGNESSPSRIEAGIYSRPVVINEIAWAGTSANQSNDEWLELKNLTPYEISLDNWILRSITDNSPYIELSGKIASNGFFLLERTDDTTISDISADQIYTGALNNTGEVLELSRASSTIDKTPEISACGTWCGGLAPFYRSMERYEPESAGDAKDNWGTWREFLQNGKNADGLNINGTPKARNTMNYLLSQANGDIFTDKNLKKSSSPYVVGQFSVIMPDATLTIEPGVVIKFLPGHSALRTEGKILARGTAEYPIVFTSFRDDEYAGDTNRDGTAGEPKPGDWISINLLGGGSEFNHTVMRYGGGENSSASAWGNLTAEHTDMILKNSVLEKSATNGASFINTSGTIELNTFRQNLPTDNSVGTGLIAASGDLNIRSNTFAENDIGLRMSGTGEVHAFKVSNNIFRENSVYAIQSSGAYPEFSGNTAEGNKINGIVISGAVTRDFEIFPDLPYVIQNTIYRVDSGNKLTIHPGVKFKLLRDGSILIRGTMQAEGTDAEKIIFTSMHDDDYGGNTDATSTPASSAGDWAKILFQNASATSTLRNAVIRYADSGIHLINSSVELENVVFRNNLVGITADASSTAINLGGNIFENNNTNTIPADLWP